MESTTRYGKHCKTNRKSLPWCALANSTSTATVKNSSSSPEKQNRKCSSTTPSANSYHPTPKARNNHKQTASGDGELWTCKQGKAEHSLEAASRKAVSLERVGCGKPLTGGDTPHLIHTMRHYLLQPQFFFGEADFFSAKRLFLRNGEGGEWRASRVTVCVTAKDNGEACFPLDFGITHTIGRQPSPPHRCDFLFFSIQP